MLISCERVLDKQNFSAVNAEIWNIDGQVNLYLNKLYADNMPTMSLSANSGYSDETYFANDFTYGEITSSDVGDFSLLNYRKIRDINIMIDGMETSELEEDMKNKYIAQARFFRAWRYWELVKLYGGVPMIMKAQDPFFDDLNQPRNNTSECIQLISEDLDFGIDHLPGRWVEADNAGRITSGAAAAYKGRVLMFYASPQFNPDNNPDRWENAYNANLQAKSILDDEGFKLDSVFSQVFLTPGFENSEAVLFRSYNSTLVTNTWEESHRPPSGGGNGGNLPTSNLVEAFPMASGKPITDAASGYDNVYYWRNRDPRFYQTIAYNGCTWVLNGRAESRQWTYYLTAQESSRTPGTGYYCRKATDPNVHVDDVSRTPTDWIEIRYAEVLLNLAECANETNRMSEAYDLLVQIRARAGIEPGADNLYGLTSGMDIVAMREAIMKEKQIELAYENKRYWDLRRRNMFAEDLGPGTPKLNGTRRRGILTRPRPPYTSQGIDTIRNGIDIETEFETYFLVQPIILDREFAINYLQPLYNFFAIPQNILDRCPAVQQTVGWDNGEFDPYQ